jgi:hypothetical protein
MACPMSRCFLGLLLLLTPLRSEVRQALFLDRSGSMRPYYQDGLVLDLARALSGVLRAEGGITAFAFSNDVTPLQSVDQVVNVPFGNFTYLDRALDSAVSSKMSLAWLITDNVQDERGAAEAGNTEVFYSRLRSDAVKRVTIFPLRQPAGRRGLVVYALLLDENASTAFERGLAEFRRRAAGLVQTEPLRMKPLDEDTVQVSFVRTGSGPKGSTAVYSTGKPVHERLEIRFKSRFDHLEISEGSIRVAEAQARFDSDSLLVPERRIISISPRIVKKLAAGDETEQIYSVDIDLGKLRLKRDLVSLWRAAWGRSVEEATLRLEFLIDVPQRNFRLRPQFLKTYHAASSQEAQATGKVYGLDQLPSLMSEQVTSVRVVSPIVFRVRYPWWPSIFWIAILLAASGTAVLAARVLKRIPLMARRDWAVQAETEAGVPLECTVDQAKVLVQRDLIGFVDRNAFTPAAGARLENGAPAAQIQPGMRLKVMTPRRVIVLRFEDKKARARTAVAYQPRRR